MDDLYFDACMELMRRGDKNGLKSIYEAYAPMIYHSIVAVVRNHENAEDLTSEFFIKLWSIHFGQRQELQKVILSQIICAKWPARF